MLMHCQPDGKQAVALIFGRSFQYSARDQPAQQLHYHSQRTDFTFSWLVADMLLPWEGEVADLDVQAVVLARAMVSESIGNLAARWMMVLQDEILSRSNE
jgi:hypothetical protein